MSVKPMLAVVALVALISPLACFALTVRDYTNLRDSANIDGFKMTRAYISGVGIGYIWSNTERAAEKLPPLFCLTPGFTATLDFVSLIDDEIGQTYVQRDDAIELLLLKALRRVYPCAGAKPLPDSE
jgi:hypothetical protein